MKILFLCVANSARSQMAEGLARCYFGDKAEFFSAGSSPKSLNPLAVETLSEMGIDISGHQAKSIDSIDVDSMDLIITLCADEVCPHVIGKQKKQHWPLPDPAAPNMSTPEKRIKFSQVRDKLIEKIQSLGQELSLNVRDHKKLRLK